MKKYMSIAICIAVLFCSSINTSADQKESHFSDGTRKFRYTGEYTEVTFKAPAAWFVDNKSISESQEMYSFHPYGEGDESLFYCIGIYDGYYMSELSNEELLESYENVNAEISALENGKRIVFADYKNDDGKPRIFILIPEDTCYITVLYGADKEIPEDYKEDFTKITEIIEATPK